MVEQKEGRLREGVFETSAESLGRMARWRARLGGIELTSELERRLGGGDRNAVEASEADGVEAATGELTSRADPSFTIAEIAEAAGVEPARVGELLCRSSELPDGVSGSTARSVLEARLREGLGVAELASRHGITVAATIACLRWAAAERRRALARRR